MTNMNTVHCAFPGELLSGVCFQAWNRARSLLVHVSVYFLKTLFKDHSVRLPFVYRCRSRPIFTIIQVNGSVSLHWWTVNRKKIRNNDQMVIRKRNQKYKTSRNPNIELLNSDYLTNWNENCTAATSKKREHHVIHSHRFSPTYPRALDNTSQIERELIFKEHAAILLYFDRQRD